MVDELAPTAANPQTVLGDNLTAPDSRQCLPGSRPAVAACAERSGPWPARFESTLELHEPGDAPAERHELQTELLRMLFTLAPYEDNKTLAG